MTRAGEAPLVAADCQVSHFPTAKTAPATIHIRTQAGQLAGRTATTSRASAPTVTNAAARSFEHRVGCRAEGLLSAGGAKAMVRTPRDLSRESNRGTAA